MAAVPLVVDLDGTLLRTDTLHESAIRLLRDSPFDVLRLPLWLARGKAALKRRLATKVGLDPAALPYRGDLLAWLREQREAGRPLVLCTAADRAVAASIAEHLGIFDQIIASDGETNLAGRRKAEALVRHFGPAGFDYAGNSSDDLPVWASARLAIVVDAPADVARRARAQGEVEREFSGTAAGLRTWARMLRVHQWLKNLLLFVPLVAAHRFGDAGSWLTLVLAFASFSLCASTVYIVNDLLDLESDRLHPRKRNRPFASGAVPVRQGVLAAPILLDRAHWQAELTPRRLKGLIARCDALVTHRKHNAVHAIGAGVRVIGLHPMVDESLRRTFIALMHRMPPGSRCMGLHGPPA